MGILWAHTGAIRCIGLTQRVRRISGADSKGHIVVVPWCHWLVSAQRREAQPRLSYITATSKLGVYLHGFLRYTRAIPVWRISAYDHTEIIWYIVA